MGDIIFPTNVCKYTLTQIDYIVNTFAKKMAFKRKERLNRTERVPAKVKAYSDSIAHDRHYHSPGLFRPICDKTTIRQLSRIILTLLAMTGRVTMLGSIKAKVAQAQKSGIMNRKQIEISRKVMSDGGEREWERN